MEKAEFKYKNIKEKVNFKVNTKVQDPILALKAEIDNIKAAVKKTKEFGTGKANRQSRETPKWTKTYPKYGKISKEAN